MNQGVASPVVQSKFGILQALRAFAAISVMLFHGSIMINERLGYEYLGNIFKAGFSGVDIFFVLSGFIILYTTDAEHLNRFLFIKKRFIRIYPTYWAVTLLLLLFYFISPSVDQSYKGELSVIFGSLLLFPQEIYIVGVAWTLAHEVVFYLIVAIAYFKNPTFFYRVLLVWVLLILSFYVFGLKTGIFALDLLGRPVNLSFILGCGVAFLYQRYRAFDSLRVLFWFGLVWFVISWLMFYFKSANETEIFSGEISRVLLFGLPASVLILGALYLPNFTSRIPIYLGDASYSIYLVHGTVLSLLIKIVDKYGFRDLFANIFGASLLFLTTIVICCIFYSFGEKKLLNVLR